METFEQWLSLNLSPDERDKNAIKGEKTREEVRQKVQRKVIIHLKETKDQTWCKCDTCILIRLKVEDEKLIDSLARIGLEYLLGENFNGISALHYYAYWKEQIEQIGAKDESGT